MRIVPLASALEGAGVVANSQGTATSQVIGRSLAASDSAYLLHTANDQSVALLNPAIDLAAGTVTARIAGSGGKPVTVFTITNAMALKPKTTTEDGVSKTTYQGARLALAPGVADVLASGLGLPTGSLPDGARFGTADVTVYAS